MHHQNLTFSCQFARYCVFEKRVALFDDVRLYGNSYIRRRIYNAYISDARKRHVKRPRYRRRSHRERIYVFFKEFQFFFMFDAESLLFVEYEQSQIMKFYVGTE